MYTENRINANFQTVLTIDQQLCDVSLWAQTFSLKYQTTLQKKKKIYLKC